MRDIRVIMPGFEASYGQQPFHPAFLDRWRGITCLRFMNWMQTVTSEIVHWQDRPRPDSATFTTRGVALEAMIDLCDRLRTGDQLNAAEFSQWSVDRLLDYLEQVSLPRSIEWMRQQKEWADKYGLQLVAYEAGPHLVGIAGAENDEQLTRLFFAANAHPRMGQLYRQYLQAWAAAGGDLLCHYHSVAAWNKFGSWGLLQYADDDPRQTPKFMATLQWARDCGQQVNLPSSRR